MSLTTIGSGTSLSSGTVFSQAANSNSNASEAEVKMNSSVRERTIRERTIRERAIGFHRALNDVQGLITAWDNFLKRNDVSISIAAKELYGHVKTVVPYNETMAVSLNELLEDINKNLPLRNTFSTPKSYFDWTQCYKTRFSIIAGNLQSDLEDPHALQSGLILLRAIGGNDAVSKFEASLKEGEKDVISRLYSLQRYISEMSCTSLDLQNRSLTLLLSLTLFPNELHYDKFLSKLKTLILSNNHLATLPTWVTGTTWVRVTSLKIDGNLFTKLPRMLKLEHLEEFDLSNNPWNEETLKQFEQFANEHPAVTYERSNDRIVFKKSTVKQ